ncbi:hypothetical protein K443DRAFT_11857 [Laccaria amethystina LaAM-08-1]|uniref:Unplaced genomic scaffold K443scaffold_244, whole genome shotgun sequence n=1 Tax=Laccaria amethystina LaAM-08-1 TaxID=1095629 RepID=A0A0C9XAM7_9AGAR|nr:hypothetical protein K443DRAFT_11857 [Laccaria amethystina LaAM-08-1]
MSSQAHWSDDDITTLITFLISKKASAGDGISFKGSVWTEAATAVNKVPHTKGAKRRQLKETYNIVADIKAQSGFKWDDNGGADIDKTTAEVWASYEKRHKGSAPFRNKGWPWYEKVQPLMPNAPRGANVYHVSSGAQPKQPDTNGLASVEDDDRPVSHWSPTPPPAVCDVAPTASDAAVAASTAVGATSAVVVNSMDCMQNNADATQTPAFSGKRRHSALSSDGAVPIKRPWGSDSHERRPSGATALYGMNNRLDDFTDAFREAFSGGKTGVDATPSRKMRAMKRAQDLETTLSDKRICS